MKKIVSLLLAAIICVTTMATPTVFAQTSNNQNTTNVLYATSSEVPEELLDYAAEIFPDIMRSHLLNNNIYEFNNFYLGLPVKVTEYSNSQNTIYHFAVIANGKVFATLSIYDDGVSYCGQLAEDMMAEKLNDMMEEATALSPIVFFSNEDGFYALVNNRIENMIPGITNDTTVPNSIQTRVFSENVVDMLQTTNISYDFNGSVPFEISNPLNVKSVAQTADGKFTSTQKNWCGAAVTAALTNYVKSKSLTAKSVTTSILGSAKDEGVTNSQIISYVKDNHSMTVSDVNPMSYTSVKTEINAGRPIYMQMQRTEGTEKHYHALGLIGYSSTLYTVINPWYDSSFTITKQDTGTSVKYITGDRTYKWYKTIKGWK